MKRKRTGFNLIELLVVIAIIAMLAQPHGEWIESVLRF
jgi:prepilin-type N-terminal cleavage/methylation domain-containing protein